MKMLNVLFRMSDTPGSVRHTGRALGADTDEVLGELGLGADRIAELRELKVLS
jgi:crotonobetainyl-CoA:carnitine CoA-transferase CaiB-like acyl-CoA transferase